MILLHDADMTERCTILISHLIQGQTNLECVLTERDLFLDVLNQYRSKLEFRTANYACLIFMFMAEFRCEYYEELCRCICLLLCEIPDEFTANSALKLLDRLVVEEQNKNLLQYLGLEMVLKPYADFYYGLIRDTRYSLGGHEAIQIGT
jgi:hypothetical protein